MWTYDYLKLLQNNIRAEKGQLLVATHNPLMIGSLYKNQVRIITQQEQATVAEEPEYDPIGIGVEGLLKSELYGLRSTLAPEVLEKLDQHYQLLGKRDKTPEEELTLIKLANELNSFCRLLDDTRIRSIFRNSIINNREKLPPATNQC